MMVRAFVFASACFVLSACSTEVAPPLTRDAGGDASVVDAGAEDSPTLDSATDAGFDAGRDAGLRTLVDLTVNGEGFADFEAYTAHARLEDRLHGLYSDEYSGVVTSGAFTIVMPQSFDRELFAMQLYLYIDTNENTVCDAETDELMQLSVENDGTSGAVSFYVEHGASNISAGTCDFF
ncbi:MAG: hypothetical protein IPK60_15030 [Sandaracinaceae bacterium]|nr:hypothetical protein [Sandaracinaceae bacterium]